jgi:hypothetical protein
MQWPCPSLAVFFKFLQHRLPVYFDSPHTADGIWPEISMKLENYYNYPPKRYSRSLYISITAFISVQ